MKKMNNKKGFTIVELVIVIAIIAILAAVLIPTFSNVIEKSHNSACLQAAKTKFEEVYAVDYSDGKIDGKENTTTINVTDAKYGAKTYTTADGKVTGFTYEDDNATASYDGTTWTVTAK